MCGARVRCGRGIRDGAHGDRCHDLWLRYDRVKDQAQLRAYRLAVTGLVAERLSPTGRVIAGELGEASAACSASTWPSRTTVRQDGMVIVSAHRRDRRRSPPSGGATGSHARRRGLSDSFDDDRRPCRDGDRVEW